MLDERYLCGRCVQEYRAANFTIKPKYTATDMDSCDRCRIRDGKVYSVEDPKEVRRGKEKLEN